LLAIGVTSDRGHQSRVDQLRIQQLRDTLVAAHAVS